MGRRILGIVDSDSFVKWGATLLAGAPNDWSVEFVAITTPSSASAAQIANALVTVDAVPGSIATATLPEILERARVGGFDAVVVSTLGPVAEVLLAEISRLVSPRPVLITGLPGISIPPKWKGVFYRAQADLFVLHSTREVSEYSELAIERGVEPNFALATLPFLAAPPQDRPQTRDSIVFAAQPSVPLLREDRQRIVRWLVSTAKANPELRVVIKTRAGAGEKQTHYEEYPYAALVPPDAPANLVVESGPMSHHLARAVGLVTVSSTSVIEAIAHGVPSIALTDFGIERRLINEVFESSGLFGTADDLIAVRFNEVHADWREDNYFHDGRLNDWIPRANRLMELRDAGVLPSRSPARRSRGGSLRRAWDRKLALGAYDRSPLGFVALTVGTPVRLTKRAVRWMLRSRAVETDESRAAVAAESRQLVSKGQLVSKS